MYLRSNARLLRALIQIAADKDVSGSNKLNVFGQSIKNGDLFGTVGHSPLYKHLFYYPGKTDIQNRRDLAVFNRRRFDARRSMLPGNTDRMPPVLVAKPATMYGGRFLQEGFVHGKEGTPIQIRKLNWLSPSVVMNTPQGASETQQAKNIRTFFDWNPRNIIANIAGKPEFGDDHEGYHIGNLPIKVDSKKFDTAETRRRGITTLMQQFSSAADNDIKKAEELHYSDRDKYSYDPEYTTQSDAEAVRNYLALKSDIHRHFGTIVNTRDEWEKALIDNGLAVRDRYGRLVLTSKGAAWDPESNDNQQQLGGLVRNEIGRQVRIGNAVRRYKSLPQAEKDKMDPKERADIEQFVKWDDYAFPAADNGVVKPGASWAQPYVKTYEVT